MPSSRVPAEPWTSWIPRPRVLGSAFGPLSTRLGEAISLATGGTLPTGGACRPERPLLPFLPRPNTHCALSQSTCLSLRSSSLSVITYHHKIPIVLDPALALHVLPSSACFKPRHVRPLTRECRAVAAQYSAWPRSGPAGASAAAAR